ncbi:superoxide dismutase-like protein isoform X1 [Tribolium castaneum]|uniref:superoxide dismutase-like protein isoform X1 n=1 Tax=Tribolium castaneum TaxID=7070 RepID=UPI00046BF951|nr:PREDICTED: superoxide dismutase-like protein isoform X1 [Tribolium castaneum]|eukprot:XP_008198346.1 PREDICTED: superoxide dismutase-like protein isoform X1 [Tribolium castaneum]
MFKLFVLALCATATLATVEKAIVCLKSGDIDGKITFTQTAEGVQVEGVINGLPKGKHGFHIHEKGALGDSCKDAGGHFNPDKKDHGAPEDAVRHVGDLGNIIADDKKVAHVNISDKIISLNGEHSIIGRAVVVHEGEDDLGKGNFNDSKTTGHAGARLVCGVIGIADGTETCPEGPGNIAISTTGNYFLLFTGLYTLFLNLRF